MEGAERVLPSSHTHTSRTETFPLPESRDLLGERGSWPLQPKLLVALWALQADAGRLLGTLFWVTFVVAVRMESWKQLGHRKATGREVFGSM